MSDSFEKIVDIINDVTGIDKDKIRIESEFIDDLDVSSLEIMAIVSEIEKIFPVKITEKELMSISSVKDIVDLVETK